MSPPRFVLVLSVRPNQIRVALVLQTGRVASSAKQAYEILDSSNGVRIFEPTEVWYKIKQVTAACIDIARTQPREIAAVALVHAALESIVWMEQTGETFSQGILSGNNPPAPEELQELISAFLKTKEVSETPNPTLYLGGMDAWLVWNLTGEFVTTEPIRSAAIQSPENRASIKTPRPCASNETNCFGKTHIRGPFAAEFPVAAVVNENAALTLGAALNESEAALVGAAVTAFQAMGYL